MEIRMPKLYHIENVGCDDITSGLARIPDDTMPFFVETIKNLNKNSTYSCMPKIELYRIPDKYIREATDSDRPESIMYMDGKKWVMKPEWCELDTTPGSLELIYADGVEQII